MKKFELKGCDTTYYRETLENGLDLILLPDDSNSNKKNYYLAFGTYYGALTNEFTPYNSKKMKTYPYGIAHFLEHKCFEVEEGKTPFEFYSETGSYVNAFTNYDTTCYVVSGSKNLKENLEELLTFVTSPYFTDENVKKEQEIIKEEIKMREDNPNYQILIQLNKNLYHDYPLKYPISGSVMDIKKITKEALYECYHTFYQPSNMFLVVGGAIQKDVVRDLVQKKVKELNFKDSNGSIKRKKLHEKLSVVKEEEVQRKGNVKVEKIAIGYKMDKKSFGIEKDYVLDLYLNMILSLNFGSSSDFALQVRKEHLASSTGYSFDSAGTIKTFVVEADVLNEKEYLKALDLKLDQLEVKKEDMERIKKVWISSEVMKTDYMEAMVDHMVSDLTVYHEINNQYIELIRDMNMFTMNQVLQALNFKNRAIVKFLPKKETTS